VTKAFTTTGPKIVTLTVRDPGGVAGTTSQNVTVGTGTITAVITFSPTNPQPGQRVFFDGRSSTSSGTGTIVEWLWDFGNGETATGATATTIFANAQTYTVRLIVRDSLGRTATTTTTVTIANPT
jgi:PKD repeat protein